jgi:hypothetical protein
MTMVEDRLRAAARAAADTVAPGSAPSLHLPARRGRRLGVPGRRPRGRWLRTMAPLAAAVSVIAVIAASLAITTSMRGHPAGTSTAQSPLASVPQYYIVLTGDTPGTDYQPQHAVVRATATGAVLATVTPPKPFSTFGGVSAAGDGRTFVLAAQTFVMKRVGGGLIQEPSPAKFFLLRLSPGGKTARLTALPLPEIPAGAYIGGIALSPDGSRLAVAFRGVTPPSVPVAQQPKIEVFTLATGSVRTWVWTGSGTITNNSGGNGEVLSWTADGRTLAFQQWVGNSIDLRLLDTSGPGGSLLSASRLAVQWAHDAETWHFVHGKVSNVIFGYSAILTPDGTRIVAATASETKHPLSSELAFTEFSARTGKVVDQLGRWRLPGLYPGQVQDVLWSDPSGSTLIVVAHKPGKPTRDPRSLNGAGYGIEFGVLRGNQFTPIPGAPPANGPGTWPTW